MDSLARICHQSRSEKLYFELQYLKKSRKKIFYLLLNVLLFIYLDCNYNMLASDYSNSNSNRVFSLTISLIPQFRLHQYSLISLFEIL